MKRFRAARLIRRRKKFKMTQQELAIAAHLSLITIGYLETGRKEPKAETVARLSEALGCSMGYFFA